MKFFKTSPFRITPSKDTSFWADRKNTKKMIDYAINEFFTNEPSRILDLWGVYGSGKSHTLSYISNFANEKCIVVYSPLPKNLKNFAELYKQSFAPNFDFKEFSLACSEIYRKYCSSANWQQTFAPVMQELLDNNLDFARIIYTIGKTLRFSSYEEAVLEEENFGLCIQWLKGETLQSVNLKKIKVQKSLKNDLEFVKLFGMITKVSNSENMNKKIIWALDDCHSFDDDKKKATVVQRGLRDLFDSCPDGFCLILASASITRDVWDDMLIGDLKSRISPTWKINLGLFDPENLTDPVQFIHDLINFEQFKLEDKDTWYPFENESVVNTTISHIQKSGIEFTPRRIMEFFSALVNNAEIQNLSIIDEKFVTEFIKN